MKNINQQSKCQGITLGVTVLTLAVITTAVGLAVVTTAQHSRIADRSQDLPVLQAAADGSLEYAFGMWKGKAGQLGRPLTLAECTAGFSAPVFPNTNVTSALTITSADEYGAPTSAPVGKIMDLAGFPGWKGRTYNYVASVRVASNNTIGGPQLVYGVKRTFQYVTVQLFQTMFFYENDFEMYRPATMIVSGLSHTNRYGHVSNDLPNGTPLTFQSPISHVMGWSNAEPYRATTWSGFVAGRNQAPTTEAAVTQVGRLEPLGGDPAGVLDTPPTGPLAPSGQLIGPDGDSDGNPNNDSFHELIEPPVTTSTDPSPIATRRLYNKAGIVVRVNGSTKTVTTQNGATLTSAQITSIQNSVTTATIYDQREQANVRVSTLNVGTARAALEASTGFNGVLYVHDVTPTTSGTPKNAVRLKNGGILPTNGLTVASENPVYIQGDYNTGTTTDPNLVPANSGGNATNGDSPTVSGYTRKPSAVIGDAVMILSNAWNDANASAAIGSRIASNTTVNTAILAGVLPSGYQPGGSTPQYGYSGGANNYPRFLENWSNKYATYYGSMVQLFVSKTFTGKWDTGNIYSPPVRCWNYDTNFTNNPPPGSVDAVFVSRGSWTRY
jgi:hypothetical protein